MPRPFFVKPALSCCGGDTFAYIPFLGYLRSESTVLGGLAAVLAATGFTVGLADGCGVGSAVGIPVGTDVGTADG